MTLTPLSYYLWNCLYTLASSLTVFIYGKCYGYKHVHVQKIMYGLYLWMFFERFFFLNLKKISLKNEFFLVSSIS